MTTLGSPFTASAKKVLLLGAGELGKEIAIELARFGVEVIACDRYLNAPAMQVAARSYVFSMLDGAELRRVVEQEKPNLIVPEIEAIATETLIELEREGYCVIPTARATQLTMNREGIRRLAAEELNLPTSRYQFADSREQLAAAAQGIGFPCVVKPVMSSSGKGQKMVRSENDIDEAWEYSQSGGRSGAGRVIVESFVNFDYEITLLTVRHRDGVTFCPPIGHLQIDGDYRESWQPQWLIEPVWAKARAIAKEITDALGGQGIFGVELFVANEDVIFSEISPRPHDTGLVTLISQNLSEFALHARAILGLPIPNIEFFGASASAAIMVEGDSQNVTFGNLDEALSAPHTSLRLFGKTAVQGHRRMGVALARGATVVEARAKVRRVRDAITIQL